MTEASVSFAGNLTDDPEPDRGSYRPSGIGNPTRAHLPC